MVRRNRCTQRACIGAAFERSCSARRTLSIASSPIDCSSVRTSTMSGIRCRLTLQSQLQSQLEHDIKRLNHDPDGRQNSVRVGCRALRSLINRRTSVFRESDYRAPRREHAPVRPRSQRRHEDTRSLGHVVTTSEMLPNVHCSDVSRRKQALPAKRCGRPRVPSYRLSYHHPTQRSSHSLDTTDAYRWSSDCDQSNRERSASDCIWYR